MSGNRRNSDSKEGGLGLGAAVLLGGAAAAVGFLARDLWSSYQEFQGQSSTSGSYGPRPWPSNGPNSTSDWEGKTDKNLDARKKQREAFRDRNNVPDEMKCVVCLDNPREICLVPCGHVCLCEDCAEKIETRCPMCQQVFKNKKVIYI